MYGIETTPIKFKTLESVESELDNLNNVSVDIELDDDSPLITINKGSLYEALSKDKNIKDAVDAGDDVEIKFIVQNSTINEEDLKQVENMLKAGENIAFTVDATIKLYVNENYVRDITVSPNVIVFKLNIPSEHIKKNRKFYALRTHINDLGKLEIKRLEDIDDSDTTITIASDKFSSFSILYENIEKSTNTTKANPNTKDNIINYVIMLISSIIGMIGIKLYTKKIKI